MFSEDENVPLVLGGLKVTVNEIMILCPALVNTTWRTACVIQAFMERAGTTPIFLTWYQYYAHSE